MTTQTPLIDLARTYGIKVHSEANHYYAGGLPYEVHLAMVAQNCHHFGFLVSPDEAVVAEAAAWVHDAIEDARQTYNDVKAELGEEVAEIAYALTSLKGRNRAERAGDAYYAGIVAAGPTAILVKLCDRLANFNYSLNTGSRMAKVYEAEMPHFLSMLLPTEDLQKQFSILEGKLNYPILCKV